MFTSVDDNNAPSSPLRHSSSGNSASILACPCVALLASGDPPTAPAMLTTAATRASLKFRVANNGFQNIRRTLGVTHEYQAVIIRRYRPGHHGVTNKLRVAGTAGQWLNIQQLYRMPEQCRIFIFLIQRRFGLQSKSIYHDTNDCSRVKIAWQLLTLASVIQTNNVLDPMI